MAPKAATAAVTAMPRTETSPASSCWATDSASALPAATVSVPRRSPSQAQYLGPQVRTAAVRPTTARAMSGAYFAWLQREAASSR